LLVSSHPEFILEDSMAVPYPDSFTTKLARTPNVGFPVGPFLYILIQFDVNEPIDLSRIIESLGHTFDQHASLVSLHSCFWNISQ
jgi:hypothetical protein